MKIGKQEVGSYMTMKMDFPGIRMLDNILCPTKWNLEIDVVALDIGPKALTQSEIQMNGGLAYQKLYFWMETCLPMCIFVDTENHIGMSIAAASDNNMMYCPDEPTDDMLVRLLHSKLTAISDGHLFIGQVRMESTDTNAMYTYTVPAEGAGLPAKVKDYVSDASLFRKPWWDRADGYSFELTRPKGCKETLDQLYGHLQDPLLEFDNTVMASTFAFDETTIPNEPAEILQVDKWQPRTV